MAVEEEELEIILKSHTHTAISFLPEGGLSLLLPWLSQRWEFMRSFRRSSRETVSVLPWAQGSGAQSRAAWAPQWSHTLQGLLTHHPLPDTCLPWAVVVGFTFGSLSDLYRLVFGGDWHFDGGLLSTNHVAAPSILSGKKKTNQTFDIFLIMRTGMGEREGQIPFSQEAYSCLGNLHRCINMG